MKKIILGLLSASVCFGSGIDLVIHNPLGVSGTRIVRAGVPLPQGKFHSSESFSLHVGTDAVPAAVTALNRWPDGSLRWISCDFPFDPQGRKNAKAELKPDSKPPVPFKGISVAQKDEGFLVDTGKARFSIRRNKGAFPEKVECSGQSFDLTGGGAYFIHADGRRFSASAVSADKVELEESSPMRSVVRAEGWFGSEKGEKFCRYIVRTHFFAGSARMRIYFTFVITGTPEEARFADIGFLIPCAPKKVEIGGLSDPANGKYLLQYEYDKFLTGTSSAPGEWKNTPDGGAAPGWIRGDSIVLAVRDFRENFPAELGSSPAGLTFHLWPAHGVSDPGYKVTNANRQYLRFCHEGKILDFRPPRVYWDVPGREGRYFREGRIENCLGLAKTTEMEIDFNATPQTAATVGAPVVAFAAPEWMCASGVWGMLHPRDEKRFPNWEKALDHRVELERRLQRDTPPGDFGMWNYGDGHSVWNAGDGRWDDLYRTWRGYHHASGSTAWKVFIRSGRLADFDRAVAASRHLTDVDICNYSTPESERPVAGAKMWTQKIRGGLNDYKGLSHWHAGSRVLDYNAQTEFMFDYAFLTGDRRGIDVAEYWGEAAKKVFRKPFSGREGAGVVNALLDLYLGTGKPEYKLLAEKFIPPLYRSQSTAEKNLRVQSHSVSYRPIAGRKLHPGAFADNWQSYAPWLPKYESITHDPEAVRRIVLWADAFAKGYGDTGDIFSLNSDYDLQALAWRFTGKREYLERGSWLLNRFAAFQRGNGGAYTAVSSTELMGIERAGVFLAAMAAAGFHENSLVGTAPEKGMTAYPFRSGKYPKRGVFELSIPGDKPELSFSADIGSELVPSSLKIKVSAPDGTEIFSDTRQIAAGCNRLELKISPAISGEYRVELDSLRYVEPLSGGKVVASGTLMNSSYGGGALWFHVPAAGKLEVKLRPRMGINSHLQLTDSRRKVLRDINIVDTERSFTNQVASGMYLLRGHFDGLEIELFADGKKIAPRFARTKEEWFAPMAPAPAAEAAKVHVSCLTRPEKE